MATALPDWLRRASPSGYAMDWVVYEDETKLSFSPPTIRAILSRTARGSYDAIRVYLWAGMTAEGDAGRGQAPRDLRSDGTGDAERSRTAGDDQSGRTRPEQRCSSRLFGGDGALSYKLGRKDGGCRAASSRDGSSSTDRRVCWEYRPVITTRTWRSSRWAGRNNGFGSIPTEH